MWGTKKRNTCSNSVKFSFLSKKKKRNVKKTPIKKLKQKKKRNYTKKMKRSNKEKRITQRGKGKYLTTVPSEYYDVKNRVSHLLENSVSKFEGNVRPIDPNPTYQNYQVSKFDISPPSSLLQK
jgi:hypothetical protein